MPKGKKAADLSMCAMTESQGLDQALLESLVSAQFYEAPKKSSSKAKVKIKNYLVIYEIVESYKSEETKKSF